MAGRGECSGKGDDDGDHVDDILVGGFALALALVGVGVCADCVLFVLFA
jgi:hypothetical protein